MTNPPPYKLRPGKRPAQAVELLRFLPAGSALNSAELRNRLEWNSTAGVHKELRAPTAHGFLRAVKRFDAKALRVRTYWMAGGVR